ncbi:MAG: polyamine aminopropyltransferase [Candidatus Aminicenantes bacterium]|nr:polyamine aminopropyltransferase [Candidatus Aminicenantes bacterium]
MGLIKKGRKLWFFEELYSDITYGFEVSKVIVPETDTGLQKMMILETDRLGRVLILDGIVQLAEEDEGIYHEWIAHWPLFALPEPADHVLIIGGGDGGVAREVLRHNYIKKVTMVEIDKVVVDLCREHMPSVSEGVFDDPRFELIIGDGAEIIRKLKGKCDVVIIDSTDPIGPAKSLFNTSFYESVKDALKDQGITIHQTGALILQPFEAPGSWRQIERTFDDVRVVQFANVSYLGGPFSLTAGSKGKHLFRNAERNAKKNFKRFGIKMNWYTPAIPANPYPEFRKRLELDKYGEEIVMDIALPGGKRPTAHQVKKWSRETCRAIRMVAYGDPLISRPEFGEGDTLVQYIETSAISYRRFGGIASSNIFTCATLPAEEAVDFSLGYFGAESAVCWSLPRGSFAGVEQIRKQCKIYKAALKKSGDPGTDIVSKIHRPRLISSATAFSPDFKLPMESGFSSAWELIMDIYDCSYSRISNCDTVARWASSEFINASGLAPLGKTDSPEFGHAKKKTAGPSVIQFLRTGSNISHYSMNWLMIVMNIVSQETFPLKKVVDSALKYFRGGYAVCWILPRGFKSRNIAEIADNTVLFPYSTSLK